MCQFSDRRRIFSLLIQHENNQIIEGEAQRFIIEIHLKRARAARIELTATTTRKKLLKEQQLFDFFFCCVASRLRRSLKLTLKRFHEIHQPKKKKSQIIFAQRKKERYLLTRQ